MSLAKLHVVTPNFTPPRKPLPLTHSTPLRHSPYRYQNEENVLQYLGLQRKVQKFDRGATPLTRLVPQFMRTFPFGMHGDELVTAVVDDARHILYTLSKRGVIEVNI